MINQRHYQHDHHSPTEAPAGGITELVLTQQAPEQHQLLLPMIAHLSKSRRRWLTWLTPGPIDRRMLEAYQVELNSIRLIHTSEQRDCRWVLWEALAQGNSHTVIASPGHLSDKDLRQLEIAAQGGACQGLLLRSR